MSLCCTRHYMQVTKQPNTFVFACSITRQCLRNIPGKYRRVGSRTYTSSARRSDRPRNESQEQSSTLPQAKHIQHASTNVTITDTLNPPASTRPPPITTPTREGKSLPAYLWKLATTYGTFYKTGAKAVFANRKLANEVWERLQMDKRATSNSARVLKAVVNGNISRAEYQLLKRSAHDMMRVPVFGVLILLLGEWLPLFVPFMPYLPPLTCRIPSQIEGMRDKAEIRRRDAFRQGTKEPLEIPKEDKDKSKDQAAPYIVDLEQARRLVEKLGKKELYHLSCVLNLHGRIWETVSIEPPSIFLRRRAAAKLAYLGQDDLLLSKGKAADALVADEVSIACEERGMDVLGPKPEQLRSQLAAWLTNRKQDSANGRLLLSMLFNRPNAWKS